MTGENWTCLDCGKRRPSYTRRCLCGGKKPTAEDILRAERRGITPCPDCKPLRPCFPHAGLSEGAFIARYSGNRALNDPGSHQSVSPVYAPKEPSAASPVHYSSTYVPPLPDPYQTRLAELRANAPAPSPSLHAPVPEGVFYYPAPSKAPLVEPAPVTGRSSDLAVALVAQENGMKEGEKSELVESEPQASKKERK